ncbi:MAG: UDP-N-acetylmuramoyl-L-alanyl-D-glutamate--2,6-diaminopimelate ligase [Acidimicrobiia bacterium]
MGRSMGHLADIVGGRLIGDGSVEVRDVTHDSRQVVPGSLYVAVVGHHVDGHRFVRDAVAAGAGGVLVQHEMDESEMERAIPQIVVGDTRLAMAPVAAEIYDHPSRRTLLVGVTGTNGKTTVTHMIESIVAASGQVPGLIGTVHTRVGPEAIPNVRTTPEATDFQRLLATMVDMGADVVAAEVSSHALEMHRVDSSTFAVAAFTNLSQDHLDFHGDMDRYFEVKARLFESDRSARAVVFVDDPAGRRLAEQVGIPVTTVGTGATISAPERRVGLTGSQFLLRSPQGEVSIDLPLGGRFNVDNALIAAGCVLELDVPLEAVVEGLSGFSGVPGRFDLVSGDDPIRIIVDYAHTPAGISEAIASARALAPGRVVAVFGAGGDRDRGKRPQMGAAAASADRVFVTSDNPRSEDPDAIIDQIMAGVPPGSDVERDPDRRRAIFAAVAEAGEGDVVLVLGRGHERGQEIAGRLIPFDDRMVAREALAARRQAVT